MAKVNALITIRDIVEEFMLFSQLAEIDYAAIKQLAIRGYQRLAWLIIPNGVVVVKDTMDSNNIIDMPSDCVEINAIYIPDIQGEFWPLTQRKTMVSTVSAGPTRDPDSPHYEGLDMQNPGGVHYAATGGVNTEGYFYIDEPNRRILFTNVDQSEVVLDYLSSGIEDTESAYVPTEATEAIHNYIASRFYKYRPGTSAA